MFMFEHLRRKLQWLTPLGPITVASVSIISVWGFRLEDKLGLKVVGHIEAGLPPLTVSCHLRHLSRTVSHSWLSQRLKDFLASVEHGEAINRQVEIQFCQYWICSVHKTLKSRAAWPTQVSTWLSFGSHWPRLGLTAVLIGAVSILEAISIAKALAEKSQDLEAVDPDRELLGESGIQKGRPSQVLMCLLRMIPDVADLCMTYS